MRLRSYSDALLRIESRAHGPSTAAVADTSIKK